MTEAKDPQLTSAEHTAKAEEYLRQAEDLNEPGTYMEKRLLSFAQVHASLAVVKAGIECLNKE